MDLLFLFLAIILLGEGNKLLLFLVLDAVLLLLSLTARHDDYDEGMGSRAMGKETKIAASGERTLLVMYDKLDYRASTETDTERKENEKRADQRGASQRGGRRGCSSAP